MIFVQILEYGFIAVAVLVLLTQVTIPGWRGQPMFPILRRKPPSLLARRTEQLEQKRQELAAAEIEREIAGLELRISELEQQGQKDEEEALRRRLDSLRVENAAAPAAGRKPGA